MARKTPRPIPIEQMREYLAVDPTSRTGLRWIKASGHRGQPGSEAGAIGTNRYFHVCFNGLFYLNSRVVYALATGDDPGDFLIDHIDRNTLNNDPGNLRCATHQENCLNSVRSLHRMVVLNMRMSARMIQWIESQREEGESRSSVVRRILVEAMAGEPEHLNVYDSKRLDK
jgi:hypothetical protein